LGYAGHTALRPVNRGGAGSFWPGIDTQWGIFHPLASPAGQGGRVQLAARRTVRADT